MKINEFKQAGQISYAEYLDLTDKFRHVSSFAYWPDADLGTATRAEALIADNEEEYNARLRPNLQKGVILLALNFGLPKNSDYGAVAPDSKLTPEARVAKLQEMHYFTNMYVKSAAHEHYYPSFDTYQGQPSVLRGAYMTDLFKFTRDEQGQLIATGLATNQGNEIGQLAKTDAELVTTNIAGLKHELQDVLHVPDKFVMVLLGGTVQSYRSELVKAFPQAKFEDMWHYKYVAKSADWEQQCASLNERVQKDIQEF